MHKQERIQASLLKGFRDYLPAAMAQRYQIMDLVRSEAGLAGFQVIGTPALEYAQTLLGQGGEETDKQVYRFTDHGGREVALRFDLTVPFARFVAEHQNDLPMPFKKLQIGEVWRGEKPQKGRYREFCQCDLDIIGADSAAADIEILTVFQRILTALDLGGFTQAVGHRLILSALIRRCLAVAPGAAEGAALIALDKLTKIGRSAVLSLLQAIPGADAQGAEALLHLVTSKDSAGHTDLQLVACELAGDQAVLQEIDRLRQVISLASTATKAGAEALRIDLTIARGLGYYTGIVFETTLTAVPHFGSISSGGRYNDLAGRFTSRDLPGVGGSIGLDRLLAAIEEMGRMPAAKPGPVFVAVATQDALGYAFELLNTLRADGIAADIGMVAKLGNQFKQADRLGSPLVLTVGTTEMQQRTYALKNMRDGTESRDQAALGVVAKIRSCWS